MPDATKPFHQAFGPTNMPITLTDILLLLGNVKVVSS